MKDKLVILIIGILVGAIIATTGFYIYNKTIAKNLNQSETMPMDENGQMWQPSSENMGEILEKPSGDNGEEPLTKPDNLNNNTNS